MPVFGWQDDATQRPLSPTFLKRPEWRADRKKEGRKKQKRWRDMRKNAAGGLNVPLFQLQAQEPRAHVKWCANEKVRVSRDLIIFSLVAGRPN